MARGGVCVHACEGVWGLACDPRNESAVTRVLALKSRAWHKGLILIGAETEHLAPFVAQNADTAWARALSEWPGHVTCLLPAHGNVAPWLTGAHTTIALRLTAHPDARALCHAFGAALVSTSANPQGRPPARSGCQARQYFGARVDMVVGGCCQTPGRTSRIVDSTTGIEYR